MRRARLLLLPLFGLACLIALAQPASPPTSAPTEVRLGDSVIPLPGPWKFEPGDSPTTNGAPLWASPAFDDSSWHDMDLHPKAGQADAFYGTSTYITGWSARGFPNLTGFAWYRLRIHIADTPDPLWLKMPDHTDDSYQIFANGQYVGHFGDFTPDGVVNYRSRPLTFELPPPDAHGDILLAIRFYMEPFVLVNGSTADSGGMHQVPLLGLRADGFYGRAQEVTGRILNVIIPVFVSFLLLVAAAGAFWIWLIDRPRPTYLWLTLALVLTAAPIAVLTTAYFSYAITEGGTNALLQPFIVLGLVCWILFWRTWFELGRSRRLDVLLAVLAAIAIFTEAGSMFSSHASPSRILFFLELNAACKAVLGFLLFVPLFQGARKDRIGVLVAAPPVILLTISLFSLELADWLRIRTSFFPFGIQVGVKEVALLLLVLVTGALVARRFINSQVAERLERLSIDQDLEHASELQQRVL
ncbi:MAG TPA: hypothetical protein VFC39_22725, partial [Acidobacteriaceae bacterium]|nr:hypothetical protein [Acidobacteriaceae bacterium]